MECQQGFFESPFYVPKNLGVWSLPLELVAVGNWAAVVLLRVNHILKWWKLWRRLDAKTENYTKKKERSPCLKRTASLHLKKNGCLEVGRRIRFLLGHFGLFSGANLLLVFSGGFSKLKLFGLMDFLLVRLSWVVFFWEEGWEGMGF